MILIYFADTLGRTCDQNVKDFKVQKVYSKQDCSVREFNGYSSTFNVGDVLIGQDFLICVCYENIRCDLASYEWGKYIVNICDLLEWDYDQKIIIYTNNMNILMKHTSIESTNSNLEVILDRLLSRFRTVEVCWIPITYNDI